MMGISEEKQREGKSNSVGTSLEGKGLCRNTYSGDTRDRVRERHLTVSACTC